MIGAGARGTSNTLALRHAPTKTELEAYERRKKFRASIEAKASALRPIPVIVPIVSPPEPDPPLWSWPSLVTPDGRSKLGAVKTIQLTVCRDYDIDLQELLSVRRFWKLVEARHASMWLCNKLTTHSVAEIGRRHGDRDHTTALYAFQKVDLIISRGGEQAARIEKLHFELKGLLHG